MFRSLQRPSLALGAALLFGLVLTSCQLPQTSEAAAASERYLFCFWNVENFFDDRDDHRQTKGDREYDSWFAQDRAALQLKLDHLCKALLGLNGGKGPDILAIAEVESPRAAELLQDALNRRLPDAALHYKNVLMKNVAGGRHIATAILTRLPVEGDRTRLHGSRLRILEGHIQVHDHDLVVLATHWTSRLSDMTGDTKGKGRAHYGDQIYGAYKAMYKRNPKVDFLVCGDFNDPPDAPSVTEHLRATADRQAVLQARDEPLLYDLFGDKDASKGFGTHFHAGRWYIFDQICVSPGLLDNEGWSCEVNTVETVNTLYRPGEKHKQPWRFGSERDKAPRGYSDHFPVTVWLTVQGN